MSVLYIDGSDKCEHNNTSVKGGCRQQNKERTASKHTFFMRRWSLSMSLSCCSSFSVRLRSHDVSYTSVSMVTRSSHSTSSPGMFCSFPRRTRDRAQSTCVDQSKSLSNLIETHNINTCLTHSNKKTVFRNWHQISSWKCKK